MLKKKWPLLQYLSDWQQVSPNCIRPSAQIRSHLKLTVKNIGTDCLDIDISKVGTHSLHTTMLLYLARNVRTSIIMLLGQWKSDALLLYLQCQVKELTEGVTSTIQHVPFHFRGHTKWRPPIEAMFNTRWPYDKQHMQMEKLANEKKIEWIDSK